MGIFRVCIVCYLIPLICFDVVQLCMVMITASDNNQWILILTCFRCTNSDFSNLEMNPFWHSHVGTGNSQQKQMHSEHHSISYNSCDLRHSQSRGRFLHQVDLNTLRCRSWKVNHRFLLGHNFESKSFSHEIHEVNKPCLSEFWNFFHRKCTLDFEKLNHRSISTEYPRHKQSWMMLSSLHPHRPEVGHCLRQKYSESKSYLFL